MDGKDWLIVAATLVGPILAVQAQKAVERIREHRGRKLAVFHRLMATRAARVSTQHVQALNMIDLAFYGRTVLGVHRRRQSEQDVLNAWREYLDHLDTKADPQAQQMWNAKADDLFVSVLHAIAIDVGFKFDRVQLRKGVYSPVAHGDLEFEWSLIRKLGLRILAGDLPLKMAVTSVPTDEAAAKGQEMLREKLSAVLDGEVAIKIRKDETA